MSNSFTTLFNISSLIHHSFISRIPINSVLKNQEIKRFFLTCVRALSLTTIFGTIEKKKKISKNSIKKNKKSTNLIVKSLALIYMF